MRMGPREGSIPFFVLVPGPFFFDACMHLALLPSYGNPASFASARRIAVHAMEYYVCLVNGKAAGISQRVWMRSCVS